MNLNWDDGGYASRVLQGDYHAQGITTGSIADDYFHTQNVLSQKIFGFSEK